MATTFEFDDISGDYEKKAIATVSKKDKCLILKIGGGMFSKVQGEFKLPQDLIPDSYTSEEESETKHSTGKSFAKKTLGAAIGSLAIKSRGQSPLLLAGSGYAAGSLLSSASATTKENVRVNLQFNDKSIFSGVLKPKVFSEFDNFFKSYDYPKYLENYNSMIGAIDALMAELRDEYAAANGAKQKELNNTLKLYKAELSGIEKKHKVITKLAKKAKTLV